MGRPASRASALEADVGAHVATDKMTGNGRGFGFVTFQDKKGAQFISIL